MNRMNHTRPQPATALTPAQAAITPPATPPGNGDKPKQPNAFFTQGTWRELHDWDRQKAAKLRQQLFDMFLYPARDGVGDPGLDQKEANSRAILHQCAEELNRADLDAVAAIARLLLLQPRDPEFFSRAQEKDVAILQALGVPTRIINAYTDHDEGSRNAAANR